MLAFISCFKTEIKLFKLNKSDKINILENFISCSAIGTLNTIH